MGLDLSNLTEYTDENSMALIKESVMGGRIFDYATLQADVKHKSAINILSSDIVGQAGGCGWAADGSTTLSQRELEVSPIKINEAICPDELEKVWAMKIMNSGSTHEALPFEQLYAEDKRDRISAMVEAIIFKGDSIGTGNLGLADGLLKLLDAETANTVDGNMNNELSITSTNIVDSVEAMVASRPADIIDRDDLVLYVGYDLYALYTAALRKANLYHNIGEDGDNFTSTILGTNVKIIAFKGLNATQRMFLTHIANVYIGEDLLNEYEQFDIFYDKNDDEVRFRSKFKIGVQVAFPELIVDFKI